MDVPETLKSPWDSTFKIPRSRSGSSSSGSIDLEDCTSIRTIGHSRGFITGQYLDERDISYINVSGQHLKGDAGLTPFVTKHFQTYYVKRVLSPFEFYLERESETSGDERLRHKKMQEVYESQETYANEYSIKVSKFMCYAYYDPHSKSWYRVRVQDFECEEGVNRAYIYYCDSGKQEYILCENLRELHSEFRGVWDSAIFKCYLYDVVPISGNMHWSVDAIAFFKELVSDQRLGAVVMVRTKRPVIEHSPDLTHDCGVVLTERLDPKERPDTFNWLMVKMGFARSIGIMSGSQSSLDIQGLVPSFKIPKPKKPKVKKKSSKGSISREELHRIATRAIADSGPDRSHPVYYEKPAKPVSDPENLLPLSIRYRIGWMTMSYMKGPGKMFIHMHDKKLALKAMEAKMKVVSLKLPQPSLKDLKPGSVVTCSMRNLKCLKSEKASNWCRAIILDIDLPQNAASVLMVDYGNIMKIRATIMYQLPDKYRLIPSFVHRVHLSDVKPNYSVSYWHRTINSAFYKYIVSHDRKNPLYYVYMPDLTDIVKFADLSQEVIFNDTDKKWVAGGTTTSKKNELINSMKDDPLLASYFCSKAVNIYYEVKVLEANPWKFANLSEYFLGSREYAKLVKAVVDKDKLHRIMVKGFGIL